MANRRKRPLSITLAAAIVFCVITFIIGYIIPSFILLDSRLASANQKIDELQAEVREKESEIKSLNSDIEDKDAANITLGETIADHLQTIEALNVRIAELESDVNFAAEAAVSGISSIDDRNQLMNAVTGLSTQQLFIILFSLFILLVFIISVTCAVIASLHKKDDNAAVLEISPVDTTAESVDAPIAMDETNEADEKIIEEPAREAEESIEVPSFGSISKGAEDFILRSTDALFKNTIDDILPSLGGFNFGITNYEDVLNKTASGKNFGNSESGDFAAYMDSSSASNKIYIIPRYTSYSDSGVAFRGVTDLFDITDESGNNITSGAIRVKAVSSPAIFSQGDNGWAIEKKGSITVLSPYNN